MFQFKKCSLGASGGTWGTRKTPGGFPWGVVPKKVPPLRLGKPFPTQGVSLDLVRICPWHSSCPVRCLCLPSSCLVLPCPVMSSFGAPLGSVWPPNLAPQIHQNRKKTQTPRKGPWIPFWGLWVPLWGLWVPKGPWDNIGFPGPMDPPQRPRSGPWVPPKGPRVFPGGPLGTHGSLGPEALRAGGLGKHETTSALSDFGRGFHAPLWAGGVRRSRF